MEWWKNLKSILGNYDEYEKEAMLHTLYFGVTLVVVQGSRFELIAALLLFFCSFRGIIYFFLEGIGNKKTYQWILQKTFDTKSKDLNRIRTSALAKLWRTKALLFSFMWLDMLLASGVIVAKLGSGFVDDMFLYIGMFSSVAVTVSFIYFILNYFRCLTINARIQ